jgi:hypothetical protein
VGTLRSDRGTDWRGTSPLAKPSGQASG